MGAVPAVLGYLGTAGAITVFDMRAGARSRPWAMPSSPSPARAIWPSSRRATPRSGRATWPSRGGRDHGGDLRLGDRGGLRRPPRLSRVTFLISAGFVTLAALLAARYLQDPQLRRAHQPARATAASQFRAFANPRFLVLVVLAAIPAKIALTGFLFYSTPIYLASIDVSPADHRPDHHALRPFDAGGHAAGCPAAQPAGRRHPDDHAGRPFDRRRPLSARLMAPELGMAVAIALFGLAQGLAAAPMLAVLPDLCPEESRRYGATGLAALLRLADGSAASSARCSPPPGPAPRPCGCHRRHRRPLGRDRPGLFLADAVLDQRW